MLISINGVFLTNDGSGTYTERAVTSAQEVKINGKQLIQVAQFLRGTQSIPYPRGNKINVVSFKCTRNFALINPSDTNPIATTEVFALTDFSLRPQSGLLVIYCGQLGNFGPMVVQAQNGVLESSPSIDATGVRLEISYTIQCGLLVAAPASGSPLLSGAGGGLLSGAGGALESST